MPNYSQKFLSENMRSINSASFTGSYQALGTPLAHPSRILKFSNKSGVLVTVTDDGTNDKFDLQPGEVNFIDETSNAVSQATLEYAVGTQFSVKGSASSGLVTLSTWYAG